MTTVNFPPELGGDDVTIDDTDNPSTGLGNGGHRLRFVLALQQFLKVAQWCKETAGTVLGYRDAAAESANDAADSASAAASSAAAAEEAAAAAGDSQGTINSRYYGALASDPTTRPNGSPMQVGDRYFNTTSSAEKVYNGAIWTIPNVSAADLANPADAGKGDAMLAVLQPFTDAVPQTQHDINAQWVSVRNFIDTAIDGVTVNQAGMQKAIAWCQTNGSRLYWPRGTHVSNGNLAGFHDVQHFGPGVIKRGAVTYAVQPKGKSTQTNTLYVSAFGSDTNDGLSSDLPIRHIQKSFDALTNAGSFLCGNWVVSLAAGTLTEYAALDGVQSRNRILIAGPEASGGQPTLVLDGAGLYTESLNGILLTNGVFARVKDIFFKNWVGGSGVGESDASAGLNISYSNVWADNCWFDTCGTGLSATRSRLYQGRGKVTNCAIGSTAFAQTTFTFGYGGATEYSGGTLFGVNYRDGSSGVIDGGIFAGCNVGARGTHQSHARVSNCAFSGSIDADVYLYTGSSVFFGSGNTHTAGKKLVTQFALSLDTATEMMYFADTGRWSFGAVGTPGYKWHFRQAATGSSVSSVAPFVLEADSPYIGLNGGATGTMGLLCAIPGTSGVASWTYTPADGNWRLKTGNVDSYRFASTVFRPVGDNSVTLGNSSARWSVVYAGTGTINTSDAREKQQTRSLSDAERAVAVRLKSLIRMFKFNDAVEKKGNEARWHAGVLAQDVQTAFVAEGLDGFQYAVLCYDEWDDQYEPIYADRPQLDSEGNPVVEDDGSPVMEQYDTGEQRPVMAAGNRYGVRYDELFAFIVAAL